MKFEVRADGLFQAPGRLVRCAVGRGGVVAAPAKSEGDGGTPAGSWPLRRLLFRADRWSAPPTGLPTQAIQPGDGWCDAPNDPNYNRAVTLPYPASAERLWRQDGVYDLLVVLGYNDAPPRPGAGSAIFLHLARPGYTPTDGCVALAASDLLAVLARASPRDALCVHLPSAGHT